MIPLNEVARYIFFSSCMAMSARMFNEMVNDPVQVEEARKEARKVLMLLRCASVLETDEVLESFDVPHPLERKDVRPECPEDGKLLGLIDVILSMLSQEELQEGQEKAFIERAIKTRDDNVITDPALLKALETTVSEEELLDLYRLVVGERH